MAEELEKAGAGAATEPFASSEPADASAISASVQIPPQKTAAVVSVPPANVGEEREKDTELVGFFAIGVAINLIMITAFFIWAVKQWKQN